MPRLAVRVPKRLLLVVAVLLASTVVAIRVWPATAASTQYEAENALIFEGAVNSDHTRFTGTGFVNYANVVGSYVQFTVTAAQAGVATLVFRYANGTTTNRPMDIAVGGTVVSVGLAFPSTGSWDIWQTSSV